MSRRPARKFLTGGLIEADSLARAFDVVAIIAFVLLLVFAVDYQNFFIALIALTSMAMIFGANIIVGEEHLDKRDAKISKKEANSITLWALIALAGFLMLDFVVPISYGILSAHSVILSAIPTTAVISISALIVVVNAISEEDFFRKALVNLISTRLRAGPYFAAFGSAAIFAVYHLAVDANSLLTVAIIMGAGFLFAFADLKTKKLSTSQIAHILNNLGAVGILAVVHAPSAALILVALL